MAETSRPLHRAPQKPLSEWQASVDLPVVGRSTKPLNDPAHLWGLNPGGTLPLPLTGANKLVARMAAESIVRGFRPPFFLAAGLVSTIDDT